MDIELLKKRTHIAVLVLLVIALLGTGAGLAISRAVGGDGETYDESIPFDEEGQPITHTDRLEMIGRDNPGFGGYVIDPEDRSIVTVFMTNVEDRQTAERIAEEVVGDQRPISEVRVAQADFLYTDLAEWFRQINQNVVPEIIDVLSGYSVKEDLNRIQIDITDSAARDTVVQALQRHGIPERAVVIEELARFQFLSQDDLQHLWRPVPGGVQIQRGGVGQIICTSGIAAKRNGVQGLMINSHCTNNAKNVGGLDNMDVHQENDPPFSSKRVAHETVDPPTFTNSTWSQCPPGSNCRWSDSAFAETRDGVSFDLGHVAKPDGLFTTVVDPPGIRFRLTDEGTPNVGDELELVGKNAGQYRVRITNACKNMPVAGIVLICQIEGDLIAGNSPVDGDSGSPAFRLISGNDHDLIGLMWGKAPFSIRIAMSNLVWIYLDLNGSWDVCVPGFGC
jgi:hypothetical protein